MDGKKTISIANSISVYDKLRREVRKNRKNAILNRKSMAANFIEEGNYMAAVEVRKEAATMLRIARKEGLKL